MARRITMLSTVLWLLGGCVGKRPAAVPEGPGLSIPVTFPVILVGDRNVVVKEDEQSLITTTVASGLNFPQFQMLDAAGVRYSIHKVTEFGRRSLLRDLGTGQYQVYLDLKREGQLSLDRAQAIVLDAAPNRNAAAERIRAVRSFSGLIEQCRKSWEWN
ncbi:MAG TPA: hypothetical protein VKU19_00595 [Bryobacteraceae bacterium]|nr:hypothetical protein [Bryobacteraceae bacterium]